MAVITHQTLGRLEFDEQGVADTTVRLETGDVAVDITFEDEVLAELLDPPAAVVTNAAELERTGREALGADLATSGDDGAMPLYKAHLLAELAPETLRALFGVSAVSDIDDATFLDGMKLVRIGVYPESDEDAIVCDYTISPELTNYLVAVSFDRQGALLDVSLES